MKKNQINTDELNKVSGGIGAIIGQKDSFSKEEENSNSITSENGQLKNHNDHVLAARKKRKK